MLNFGLSIRQALRDSLVATLAFSFALVPFNAALSENLKDPSDFHVCEKAASSANEKQAVVDSSSSSSVNVLARDYSVHPVLGTKAGEHFKGDLNAVDLDKLCGDGHFWFSDLRYDANYLAHEPAEIDLAETMCKLALAGKFNTFRPTNLDPEFITNVKVSVGFNCIPVQLTYRGFDCTKAVFGDSVEHEYKHDLPLTGPYRPEILKHSILDTAEFGSLGAISLSDQKFKELNDDPGATDFYESQYIGASKCFRRAEGGAALQFRDRVAGLEDAEIIKIAGEPSVKTGPVLVWGDSDKYKKNWVYYFGHSGIPVRLVFDGSKCIGSALLSGAQQRDMGEWNMFRFASMRPDEIASGKAKLSDPPVREIAGFRIAMGNPEGRSRAEILSLFGEPQAITKDAADHPVYIYGTARFAWVEIPIVNDQAYGRISHTLRCGWTRRKPKQTTKTEQIK
jgi:hypothetical protein